MKIFSSNRPVQNTSSSRGPQGKAQAKPKAGHVKKELSSNEIREKVAANAQISEAAKLKAAQASQKLGEGFMKSEDHLLKSDVQLNDPEDPATSEKLKTALSNGSFNFNAKEREVLSKILEG